MISDQDAPDAMFCIMADSEEPSDDLGSCKHARHGGGH